MAETDPKRASAIERIVRQQPTRHERYPLLEVAFGRFVLGFWQAVRDLAGDEAQVRHGPSSVARFAEYRSGLQPASMLAVFTIAPWEGEGLVVLDAGLVDAATELLLGRGRLPGSSAPPRPYTPADRAVVARLLRLIIDALAAAISGLDDDLGPTRARLTKVESNPELVPISRDEMVSIARFEAVLGAGGALGGGFDIVLPHSTLAPVRRVLLQPAGRGPAPSIRRGRPGQVPGLLEAPVTLHAAVEQHRVSLLEITRWEVGMVIPLTADAEQPISVYYGQDGGPGVGRKIFTGRLGALRGCRAVRIAQLIGDPDEVSTEEVAQCRPLRS